MEHLSKYERREAVVARCALARANLLKGNHLNNEVWDEAFGQGGFDLHDGWARIWALGKDGVLHLFKRARLEEAWLGALSLEAKNIEEMTKWPLGSLPKANPWRKPFFSRTVVQAPKWDKVERQWKVEFDCKPSLTFWFKDEFIKSSHLYGWLTPRKQSSTFPWEEGGGVIKDKKNRALFVPRLSNEEIGLLLDGNVAKVIRELHKRHAKELKDRDLCVMDIKEGVDKLLEVLR